MPRRRPSHRFEVVWQTASAGDPVVLRSFADPDHATLAFHEELQRLTRQGAAGELHMRKPHGAPSPLLRQPLARHVRPPEQEQRS